MLKERFGIDRIKAVVGWSMGAGQTFQWGPISRHGRGHRAALWLIKNPHFNKVFLISLKRALELDPVLRRLLHGTAAEGLKAFAAIYAAGAFSEPFFRTRNSAR